jgi:signal transduction histidine kinase
VHVRTTDMEAGPFMVTLDSPKSPVSQIATPVRGTTAGNSTDAAMRRLNRSLEMESARIARVLHDEASQFLAAAHVAIADVSCDVPPLLQVRLKQARAHLDEVANQLHTISDTLHPSILDDLDLVEAVQFMARAFTRGTGIQVTFEARMDEPCPAAAAAIAYRLVQAALANVGQHSGAASASVAITCQGSRLSCAISDDGVGFDVAATLGADAHRMSALLLVRDRVEAAGATLDITATPQRGTHVRAVIPLEF